MVKNFLFGSILILLIIIASSSASAEITKSNLSITEVYSSGKVFDGKLSFLMKDFPAESMLTLNIESLSIQQIPLRSFLEMNNISYSCNPSNCLSYYTIESPATSKTLNGEKYIAFIASGNNIQVQSLQFDMLGQDIKPECYSTPLAFDLLDDMYYDWKYLIPGEGYCTDLIKSDSYDDSIGDYSYALLDTAYCEKIKLPIAKKFGLAADIQKGDETMLLEMSIGNSGFNTDPLSSCFVDTTNMTSETGIIECEVNFTALDEKEYDVCIRVDPIDYNPVKQSHMIKSERIEPYRGFIPGNSEVDFALYAKASDFTNFSDVSVFENSEFYGIVPSGATKENALKVYIQNYISKATNGTNKSSGGSPTIIPLKIKSTQDIVFSNLQFYYSPSGGSFFENKFYDALKNSAYLNSSGNLKFGIAEFRVPIKYGKYTYELKIGDDSVKTGSLSVEKLPTIRLSPLNVSAAVSTSFTIIADENASAYYWDFGDGAKEQTSLPVTSHIYNSIGAYTAIVTITTLRGFNVSQDFIVYAGNPKEVVNSSLVQKSNYLKKFQSDLNSLPEWYKSLASEQIGMAEMLRTLQEYQTEYSGLNPDYVALKAKLDSFAVYKGIKSDEIGIAPLLPVTDIDLLQSAGAGTIKDRANTESDIGTWQGLVDVKSSGTVKIAESENPANDRDLLTILTIELTPSQSLGKVFVILRGMSNAKFLENDTHQPIDGSELFIIDSFSEKKTIDFAVSGRYNPSDLEVIVSPEFSALIVGEYYCGNGICDTDQQESYENCPDDCKQPLTSKIVFALIIIIIAAGAAYWIWKVYTKIYENKLEKSLFKNKADLYNLTFFITKALNKNEAEDAIRKKLIEAKWDPGQVDFALMKIKKERKAVQLNTLKNFISSEMRMNKNEETIKSELKEAGWQPKDIDDAYKRILKDIETEKKKIEEKARQMQKQAQKSAMPRK